MREMRLAILFSGNGSNLENIYKKMQGMVIDSAESQNLGGKSLSLRDSAKQNRGKPPYENNAELQRGLPRSHLLARNDEFLDSSLRKCSAQNDDLNAESALDSAHPKQEANSSIVDEFLRSCEASDTDRTNGSSRKRGERECEKSPQDEFATIKLNFVLAISSKESAFGITRCKNIGLKCEVVDYKKNKENFFQKIMQILRDEKIDLVILAGFMRILPPTFTAKFRAINIHPSILPLFKGANAIKESFESDMKIAGVSVHFVSDELDSGALIAQDIIHKIEGESLENFEARIHELEYKLYPKAIIKAVKIVGNSQNIGKNNQSLRDSAKQNSGKPPIEKNAKLQSGWLLRNARKSFGLPREQSSLAMTRNNNFAESSTELQGGWLLRNARKSFGLPRSRSLARNDEILDSSLRKCSAQNDKIGAENDKNGVRVVESSLDSAKTRKKTPNL